MHGSSSVPKEWVDRINNAGGKMQEHQRRERRSIPAGRQERHLQDQHRHRWPAGLVCIHREAFRDDPSNFDLRPPGKVFIQAYAEYIIHKNQKLGSAGQLENVRKSVQAYM